MHEGPHQREELVLRELRRPEWNLFFQTQVPYDFVQLCLYCSFCGLLWSPFKDVSSRRYGTQTELTLLLSS